METMVWTLQNYDEECFSEEKKREQRLNFLTRLQVMNKSIFYFIP